MAVASEVLFTDFMVQHGENLQKTAIQEPTDAHPLRVIWLYQWSQKQKMLQGSSKLRALPTAAPGNTKYFQQSYGNT